MMITLKEVTAENFESLIALSVREDQPFVAPNLYSIAQAKIYPECTIKGIYLKEEPIGFLMFGRDDEEVKTPYPWLIRFMIDARYQGKGYGKEALRLTLELMASTYPNEPIYLSTNPENKHAIAFYEAFGFVSTGQFQHDELVFIKAWKEQEHD